MVQIITNPDINEIYDCINRGAIPIYIRQPEDGQFWEKYGNNLINILEIDMIENIVNYFMKFPEKAQKYQQGLLENI
jgi:hypothetical protein